MLRQLGWVHVIWEHDFVSPVPRPDPSLEGGGDAGLPTLLQPASRINLVWHLLHLRIMASDMASSIRRLAEMPCSSSALRTASSQLKGMCVFWLHSRQLTSLHLRQINSLFR